MILGAPSFDWIEREKRKMDEMEVKKQVQQMVHFIRQEAEEKANEISISAEEVGTSPLKPLFLVIFLLKKSMIWDGLRNIGVRH